MECVADYQPQNKCNLESSPQTRLSAPDSAHLLRNGFFINCHTTAHSTQFTDHFNGNVLQGGISCSRIARVVKHFNQKDVMYFVQRCGACSVFCCRYCYSSIVATRDSYIYIIGLGSKSRLPMILYVRDCTKVKSSSFQYIKGRFHSCTSINLHVYNPRVYFKSDHVNSVCNYIEFQHAPTYARR